MNYYCQVYNKNIQPSSHDDWQGPFESVSPQAAASLWIKEEWDCRHGESIIVVVKDDENQQYIVRYQAKVMLTLEAAAVPDCIS